MKEYNWREEREKFRPEFMKSQPEQPEPAEPPRIVRRPKVALIVAAAVIAVLIAVVLVVIFTRDDAIGVLSDNSGSSAKDRDAATMLARAAERHKGAVGLAVLTVELQNGNKIPLPVGTVWAFAPDKFATNAHVAHGLREVRDKAKNHLALMLAENLAKKKGFKDLDGYLKQLGEAGTTELQERCLADAAKLIRDVDASVLINGAHRKSYPVKYVQIHRDFGVAGSKFDPDVAVLTIDGKHDVWFKIADSGVLAALRSGEPIAFLGFPMENLDSGNVNIDNPVASMQSGIVVAVSDFEMKDAGAAGNYLIRHNLPSTGGASGSPIFDRNGEVVALLFAVNVIGQVKNGEVERAPSAAQINFAVRSDLLRGMGAPIGIREFLAR